MQRWSIALLSTAALLVAAGPAAPPVASFSEVDVSTLDAPVPEWYTDALHEETLAAAESGEGVALPDGIEVPASALAFTGIRPGSWMISPAGCTLNFVFGSLPDSEATSTNTADTTPQPSNGDRGDGNGDKSDRGDGNRGGSDLRESGDDGGNGNGPPEHARKDKGGGGSGGGGGGDTYIGTAGHCTEVGDEVTIVAAPGVLMNIGETVRSVDEGVGDDFALIEIHDEMVEHVNPSTAYYGGPTAEGDPQVGDLVGHAGHGVGIGTGGTPRAGLVVYRGEGDSRRSDAFAWDGAATPGDSGSFVVDLDGVTAAGNLTHIVVGGPYLPGVIAGTSIDRMREIAGKPLVTAPAGPDPTS